MPPVRSLPCSVWLYGLLVLPAAAIAGPGSETAVNYTLDPVHTRVMFAVSHAGFSHALGTVSGSTGTLKFDPADWTTAKLSVSVPLTRIDLGDEKWNHAAGARNLLDVAQYPVATFVSTRIEPRDAEHAVVCGTFALHGVERDVCMDVTLNQLKRHPMPPFRRTAGFSATATLSRKAFGIDAWPSVIGDEVELRIEAEALRSNAASGPAAETAPTLPTDPADETALPPDEPRSDEQRSDELRPDDPPPAP